MTNSADDHPPFLGDDETIEKPRPASAFRVRTGPEIWAPLEPPEYLVEPVFVRGCLALIVAYGASLKTWIEIDGALSISMGEAWLAMYPTRQGPALLIDFESGDYELRRRLHKVARGREWEIPIDGISFVSMPEFSLADDGFFEALLPLAEAHRFIGIDSLAAGSGGIDENDARFARSLQRLKSIASTTGCVIAVLHRARKGGGEDSDEREMVRGTSAIFNAVDVVLQLRRADEGSFTMRQTKARGGKSIDPVTVRVDDTANGGALVTATSAAGPKGAALPMAAGIEGAKRRIVALLGEAHDIRSANEIHRRVRGNKRTNLDAIDELEERGTVVRNQGVFRLASEVT